MASLLEGAPGAVTQENPETASAASGLRQELEDAHRMMCSLRAFELVVADAVRDGRLQGLLHLCIGARTPEKIETAMRSVLEA